MDWEDCFRGYLKSWTLLTCGCLRDMNVAHKEIDLKNPKSNRGNPGFTDEERENIHHTA
jgi:exodeoxyribonuclease-3